MVHEWSMTGSAELLAALRQYWGYESFRPLQEPIVESLLAGRDVAARAARHPHAVEVE